MSLRLFIATEPGGEATTLVPENEVDGLSSLKLTLRDEDEKGRQVKSFTLSLTFKGATYEYFRDRIIDNDKGQLEVINAIIVDDCCGGTIEINGEILGKSCSWCEGVCEIKCNVQERKPVLDCLDTTLIYESDKIGPGNQAPTGFINKQHPRIRWCTQTKPSWYQYLQFIWGIFHIFGMLSLVPIILLINGIFIPFCKALQYLTGKSCGNTIANGIGDEALAQFDDMTERIVGCRRNHPSPLLRDYINNVCEICGSKFVSSVFNDPTSPYWNTMYFYAPVDEGVDNDSPNYWNDLNRPIKTGAKLLDEVKEVINGRWKTLEDGSIVLERKDYFQSREIWLDTRSLVRPPEEPQIIKKQCYFYNQNKVYSYANMYYPKDGADGVGDEAIPKWSDIIELNDPYNPAQKDELKPDLFLFGAARFRGDNISEDVRDFGLFKNFPAYAQEINPSRNALLLERGIAAFPKLLIWDTTSRDNAKVVRYNVNGNDDDFNYPYVFKNRGLAPAQYAGDKLQMSVEGNLWHNFWQIEDPRLGLTQPRDYEFVFEYTCAQKASFSLAKNIILDYLGEPKQGTIEECTIDYDAKTMTVKGSI